MATRDEVLDNLLEELKTIRRRLPVAVATKIALPEARGRESADPRSTQ
jgi:hypothetical protein